MQIPKAEMREDILRAAENEFVKRGYGPSSLRTIAQKANTTVGNLYHYFDNKEAILDEIIGDSYENIVEIIYTHQEFDYTTLHVEKMTPYQLADCIEQLLPKLFRIDILLSNVMVILMEGCENTKYEKTRDQLTAIFHKHLTEHFPGEKNELLNHIIVHTIISAILYAAKNKKNMEEGVEMLSKYLRMLVLGMFYSKEFFMDEQ